MNNVSYANTFERCEIPAHIQNAISKEYVNYKPILIFSLISLVAVIPVLLPSFFEVENIFGVISNLLILVLFGFIGFFVVVYLIDLRIRRKHPNKIIESNTSS